MKKNKTDVVKGWVRKAESDFKASKASIQADALDAACFHAQQMAEKYLKAFLVYCGIDFPYTHNISTLLELCSDHADWPNELQEAEQLTLYSVTTRYPGEAEEVTDAEATSAIEVARKVRDRVREELKLLGMELKK